MTDPNFPAFSKLEKYYQKREIILETAEQIQKDFDHFGIAIEFSNSSSFAYNELYGEIYPVIAEMLDRHFERLMNILYRIDLSEKKVRLQFEKSLEEDFAAYLTNNIIKRELQKVLIRRHFNPDKD